MAIYEQIKSMYANSLHSNVVNLGTFALSIGDGYGDSDFGPSHQYQSMVYIGYSLHELGEYKRSENMLRKAIQLGKVIIKNKQAKSLDLYSDGTSETDVKYVMAQCSIAVKENKSAISTLESVPQKHRTAKVNMMLGNLYYYANMERPAIVSYKEVLKESPLALEAIQQLLSLGVLPEEITSLMTSGQNTLTIPNWLTTWINGHASMHNRDYQQAITSFKTLEESICFKKNSLVMVSLGEASYLAGDSTTALSFLSKAHRNDPMNLRGIDLLASLLAQDKRNRELESLSMAATSITENAPQPWIVVGYYCQLTKRTTKAVYFAHKACSIGPRSVEGLLLKASLLLELKKVQEAIMHFREVLQMASHRFEPHKGLVECYLATGRSRDAANVAVNALKLLGHTPRSMTLYASVLLKDPGYVAKGKYLLSKALRKDPYHLPAVYLLCDSYISEGKYSAAIDVLREQVAVQSTYKLHQMLSECHSHVHEEDKAAHHFSIALNLSQDAGSPQPSEQRRVEHPTTDSLDMDVEEIAESEGDVEENDLEAVWSDVDFSLSTQ